MMALKLENSTRFDGVQGQLLLVILDGVGLYRGQADGYDGNAYDRASTPNLDRLMREAPVFRQLKAHGTAVGLPSDGDMGNSEVGHNAIGAGRIFDQGAQLVNRAIADGSLFEGDAWRQLTSRVKAENSVFHLIGLLSDGNVHSHINHLEALIQRLVVDGVEKIRVHPLADGRDVDPTSFDRYLVQLEGFLAEARKAGVDAAVASGGGRMKITMDRYNASWEMVRRGWKTHVHGDGRLFPSALDAVAKLREENPGIIDQDLPPFVVEGDNGEAAGRIRDGDSVVFFNFRGDRSIEISRAFTEEDFDEFDRGPVPDVLYAGMMEYDGDLAIPPLYLVSPPAISRTLSEYLVGSGVRQFAVAETQKFGHVTYFWNGNNSEPFDSALETWVEIPSDDVPFEQTPAMKAYEVCDEVIAALEENSYRFVRVNFANGDMVGHTGSLAAAIRAMEVVDDCIGKLEEAVQRVGATMIVTADHGNLDMMWEVDKRTGQPKLDDNGKPVAKTSHTLSPVPWLLVGRDAELFEANDDVGEGGLGNIASTIMLLLGFDAPTDYLPPLIRSKG